MMLSSAAAGPVGRSPILLPVLKSLHTHADQLSDSDCERLVRSRMTRTPEELITCAPGRLLTPTEDGASFAYAAQQFLKHFSVSRPNSFLTA